MPTDEEHCCPFASGETVYVTSTESPPYRAVVVGCTHHPTGLREGTWVDVDDGLGPEQGQPSTPSQQAGAEAADGSPLQAELTDDQ